VGESPASSLAATAAALRAAATAAAARAAAAAAEADEAADDFARRFDAFDLMTRPDLLAALAAKGAPAPAGRPPRAELRAKLRALGKTGAAAPAKAATAAKAAAAADSEDEAPPPPKAAAAKAAAARAPAADDSDSDGDGGAAKAAAAAKLAAARKKLAEEEAAEEAAASAAAAAKEGASPKKADSASSSSPKALARAASERGSGPTLASVADGLRADGLTSSQMVIFIDCTKSNATETGRHSFGGKSLHDVSGGAKALNPYQHVLSVVGRTLAPFDADGIFPVYGASRAPACGARVVALPPPHTPSPRLT
jgi:hypothetical protein